MMTSWNGIIFRVTDPLCGEFTGHRWIPHTKASDTELWCFVFYRHLNKRLSKQSRGWWFETPSCSLWLHCIQYFDIDENRRNSRTMKFGLVILTRGGVTHQMNTQRWRHQMDAFSALLALCAGNSPATGEFPSQRPVTRSFGVLFDLGLNKRLSKQSRRWWFETPSCSLLSHCNAIRFIFGGFPVVDRDNHKGPSVEYINHHLEDGQFVEFIRAR